MRENYLAKWLNNELSEEELAEFKRSEAYAAYQKIVDTTEDLQAPAFDTNEAWATFKAQQMSSKGKVVQLHPFRSFLRVAAIIAIAIMGAYLYIKPQKEIVETQLAEQTEVVLPDASTVLLNAASKLSYHKKEWNQKREVVLEGEAFFKVAKGKKFTVATELGSIAVLGTQFNVSQRADFFEVRCYEGLVSVTYQGEEHQLPAGASFKVINSTEQAATAVTDNAPSWVKDESSFESVPLKFVFAELERQFAITVETQNVDTEQLFTGTFNNTEINLALKSIGKPSRLQYRVAGDKVLFYAGDTP
ncbi:MAG: FecR domain-containing protein [Bacteroidota bacterium]